MADKTKEWGIFDADLKPVFDYDTILSMRVEARDTVSNFPVEKGAFATYNKVRQPIRITVTLSVGAIQSQRTGISISEMRRRGKDRRGKLLSDLTIARISTDVYNITMPEGTYPRMTLQDYSFAREQTKGGPSRIVAELIFIEVREVVSQYTNSKVRFSGGPAAGSKNDGKKQEIIPNPQWETFDNTKKFLSGELNLKNTPHFIFKPVL